MIQCGFCGKKKSLDAAINAGWHPLYWFDINGNEVESDQAVCPQDIARHCHDPGDTGELLVRRGHERYLKHDPQYDQMATAAPAGTVRRLRRLRHARGRQ